MNKRRLKEQTYWKNSDRIILWAAAAHPERIVLPEAVLDAMKNSVLCDDHDMWYESPRGIKAQEEFREWLYETYMRLRREGKIKS